MSRVRHKAPLARRVELTQATKGMAPATYRLEPTNRRQRRMLARALRNARAKTKAPKRGDI